MEITCPSGLRGSIRGMKGREAQAFVDPTMIRNHQTMENLLSSCWLETLDPGPYKLVATKTGPDRPPWKSVLLGDRLHALMEIRTKTFGPDYFFKVKCTSCDQPYEWEILLSDLERKELPEASFDKIQAGRNRFELPLPDGKVLAFKLSTGEEEIAIAKLKGGAGSTKRLGPVDAITVQALGVFVRIHDDTETKTHEVAPETEGEDGAVLKPIPGGPMGIRRYLDDVDFPDLMDLLKAMQEHDCGITTSIETICSKCQWQQEIELPFQPSFFERRAKKAGA